MYTLQWFFFEILTPVVVFFYPVCDVLLGWTARLGPVAGIIAIAFLTGLGVNLFQKYCSDQKLLGQCKEDLDKLKKFMAGARKAGDDDKFARLMNVSKRISGKYMWGSLKPALLTVPPVVVVAMWTGSRMGYKTVKPNEPVEVVAYFEDNARGHAHLVPSEGLEVLGAPISEIKMGRETPEMREQRLKAAEKNWGQRWYKPWRWFSEPSEDEKKALRDNAPPPLIGQEAHWKIAAAREGDYAMSFRYPTEAGLREHQIEVPILAGSGYAPEFMSVFGFDSPTLDHVQVVQIGTIGKSESMPVAWWNLWFQWMGLYVLVAVACGVGLRFALRVN